MTPAQKNESKALRAVCQALGGASGTFHRVSGSHLVLVDAIGIPASIEEKIGRIPKGKGMAGEAWASERPMQTCNLASDPSPVIRPGARTVSAAAAMAVPLLGDDGAVWGVLGIGFPENQNLDETTLTDWASAAAELFKSHLNRAPQ